MKLHFPILLVFISNIGPSFCLCSNGTKNIFYGGKDYCLRIGESLPFFTSHYLCTTAKGILLKIRDAGENTLVTRALRESGQSKGLVFIGVYAPFPNESTWKYIDGSDVVYTNWDRTPKFDPLRSCVAMNVSDGKWLQTECSRQLASICQIPLTTEPCPPSASHLSATNSCYFGLASTGALSWQEAEEFCQNSFKGAHLASIHSLTEFLTVYAMATTVNASLWVGARCVNEQWVWSDGSSFDYTPPGIQKVVQLFGWFYDGCKNGESTICHTRSGVLSDNFGRDPLMGWQCETETNTTVKTSTLYQNGAVCKSIAS